MILSTLCVPDLCCCAPQNLWGSEENPALTTAVLPSAVLQKGMFIGWSGSELDAFPGTKRAYFLDRSARRLYTLAISDGLDAVITDLITGINPKSSMTAPLHFDLSTPEFVPAYGQVNHYYNFARFSYTPSGELLYVQQGNYKFRQAAAMLLFFLQSFCADT